MPLCSIAFVMKVSDVAPPGFYVPPYRTEAVKAPGDYTLDQYRATAGAGVVALHRNLTELDSAIGRRLLECILPHYAAAAAAPCGTTATPAIVHLYKELLARWTGTFQESSLSTNMVIEAPNGTAVYVAVHAFVCPRPQA